MYLYIYIYKIRFVNKLTTLLQVVHPVFDFIIIFFFIHIALDKK